MVVVVMKVVYIRRVRGQMKSPDLQQCISTVGTFLSQNKPSKKEVKLMQRARLKESMKPDSGALRVAVDCSVDNVYRMSEKLRHKQRMMCDQSMHMIS